MTEFNRTGRAKVRGILQTDRRVWCMGRCLLFDCLLNRFEMARLQPPTKLRKSMIHMHACICMSGVLCHFCPLAGSGMEWTSGVPQHVGHTALMYV